jgi:hypothetical protein
MKDLYWGFYQMSDSDSDNIEFEPTCKEKFLFDGFEPIEVSCDCGATVFSSHSGFKVMDKDNLIFEFVDKEGSGFRTMDYDTDLLYNEDDKMIYCPCCQGPVNIIVD